MNLVDMLLIVIVLMAVWSGWQKGFIIGTIDLGILAGSILLAYFLYPFLAAIVQEYIPKLGVWTDPLSFLFTYIMARVVISWLVHLVTRNVPHETHVHTINKVFGMAPGLVKGFLYAIVVAALLLALPLSDTVSATTRDSRLANQLIVPAEWIESKLSPLFDQAVKKTMNKLTVDPESKRVIHLPYTVKDAGVREDLEARMLKLVNQEREKEGLPPLKADPELTLVARDHSRDMFSRGYFAHETPEGKDPFDRMRAAQVRFLTAGENLALAQTLLLAHNGLMNSPGHKANILQPAFGRLGIGILDGGIHGLMVTQNFRN